MKTDHTIIQLDNNTDLLLLDDENDLRNVVTIDQAHQFLNFSRKIAESSSMKRPVDIQLGIACGKDLIFSRSLLNKSPLNRNPKNPLQLVNTVASNPDKNSLFQGNSTNSNNNEDLLLQIDKKGENRNSPLREQHQSPPQTCDESTQEINNKNANSNNNKNSTSQSYRTNTMHQFDKTFEKMRMNQTKRGNSSGQLDRLVADVLRHIESCPDQSAYSDDLDRLKPKLEAYKVTRQKA